MPFSRIAFIAADSPQAREALAALTQRYGKHSPEQADVIVALGGDGIMLEALHRQLSVNVPVFGMHRGTVGFLMNRYDETDLLQRLARTTEVTLYPLRMTAVSADGKSHEALAVNEVSMLRQTRQAAKIRIFVNERERMSELVCDGALLCTPVGSTAYNISVYGPVLPINSNVLALTPISAFRPRRWRGAIIPHTASVRFVMLEHDRRPVSAVADRIEVRDVVEVTVREDRAVTLRILFDPDHNLEERIVAEQFAP